MPAAGVRLHPSGPRRGLRTLPATLMLLVALALLAGCQQSKQPKQPQPAPEARQILRVPLVTDQSLTLDPALITDSGSALVASLIYPSLMALDSHLEPHPWAAQSVDVSADGLKLTAHLRQGMRFSDGEPITAQTFAFSLNRALDPCAGALDAQPLFMIADAEAFHQEPCADAVTGTALGPLTTLIGADGPITVVDPQTLTLRLARPWAGALAALTAPAAFAVPQELVASAGSQWTARLTDGSGLGGGLFGLAQAPEMGANAQPAEARLTRNPLFWGAAPILREIDVFLYASQTREWTDYQAGKLDIGYPPVAVASRESAATQAAIQVDPLLNLMYIGLNARMAPLTDEGLRQALALAINKRSLASDTLGGTMAPTNHLMPAGEPGYNPALVGPDQTQNLAGDTAKAVKLAREFASSRCMGQFARCPALTLEVATEDSAGLAAAEAFARSWQAVAPGYPLLVHQESRATLRARVASSAAQLYLDEWQASYPDPSAWLDAAFGPGAPGANAGSASPDVATLLAQGEADLDPAQRAKDYQAAEQLLVSEVAWIPLAQEQALWQARPEVVGVTLDAQGELAVYDTVPTVAIMRLPTAG